jgi:hypothetical protein
VSNVKTTTERRRYRRFELMGLVQTKFGTHLMKNVSAGGVCIVASPTIKERLSLHETLELSVATLHGHLLPIQVGIRCSGEVVRIDDPSPYMTEVAIRFGEVIRINEANSRITEVVIRFSDIFADEEEPCPFPMEGCALGAEL